MWRSAPAVRMLVKFDKHVVNYVSVLFRRQDKQYAESESEK